VELDPAYCDVIIHRWEKLTGQKALHRESGKSVAETLKERRYSPPPSGSISTAPSNQHLEPLRKDHASANEEVL
jgi:hypothetical protein